MVAPLVDPSQIHLTRNERTYLNFFRQNTSKQVAGYFSHTFWEELVHQVVESQPVVRHAAIGVGAMHWHHDVRTLGHENQSLPLQQCSKALLHLQQLLAIGLSDHTQVETVLSACIVLGALSMIQGDARAVTWHLGSGWRLLEYWQTINLHNSPLRARLLQTFMQTKLRWFSLADGDMYVDLTLPDVIVSRFSAIENLESAEESAGFITAIGWLALQIKTRPKSGNPTERHGVAVSLLRKLQAGRDRIQETMKSNQDQSVIRVKGMITFLDIWSKILLIRVLTDAKIDEGETRYDAYLPVFQDVIQMAEHLLLQPRLEIWMGIATPLVFCTLKCRDWDVRDRALKLLKIWPYTKEKWSMSNTALVVEQAVQKESGGFRPPESIPESCRIDSLRVEFLPGRPRIRISYRRAYLHRFKASSPAQSRAWENIILPY